MYNLTYSEFVREVNKGMVISGTAIKSAGSAEELEARTRLLAPYTFVVKIEEVKVIGISTTTKIKDELLIPVIAIKFLTTINGKLHAHTDASAVPEKVLLMYASMRRHIVNWSAGHGAFDNFMSNYDTEVIARDG